MATTPENRVKNAIKKWLVSQRIYYFSAAAGPFTVHGVPDLVACYKGRFIGIECKAPGKEKNTTRNQDHHIQRINDAGGLAFVATSVQDVMVQFASLS